MLRCTCRGLLLPRMHGPSDHNASPFRGASSTLDLIGRTPLVALDRVHPGPGRILAKAEFLQPGGSVKDRAARAILLAARSDGRLRPGAPVVEMTSGNMGAGLAVACAALVRLQRTLFDQGPCGICRGMKPLFVR